MIRYLLIFLCLSSLVYSEEYFIKINRIKQGKNLCVPASVSMVLQYYGETIDQKDLKRIIENVEFKNTDKRLYTTTAFAKVERSLKFIGYEWEEVRFDTNSGNNGMEFIKKQIQDNNPVIVDIKTKYGQHAVIINGFGTDYFIVTDPMQVSSFKKYKFMEFRKIWHSGSCGRYLLKTQNKK